MFSQAAPFVIWPLHKHVVVETHEALDHQIYSSRFCGGLEFLFEMSGDDGHSSYKAKQDYSESKTGGQP